MSFWVRLLSFLNKVAPWLVVLVAYMKGRKAAQEEVNQINLEKELEYAKIDAAKPDTIDDDLDRMRSGTF